MRANCYQMLSEAIRSHQNASKVNQKHSKIHQRYIRMHQKTPVFLLNYCHNKDLKKIKPQINADSRRFFYFSLNFIPYNIGI